jgi:isopropylmalate/homocitrate/citramalate synthase
MGRERFEYKNKDTGGSGMGSEKPWAVLGKWSVGIYNWADEVRKLMPNLPKKVEIRDVTLREADDQMGLYLTIEDRVKLALKVAEIGIKEIDIGGPGLLPHQGEACKAIRKAYDSAGIDKSITRISGRYFGTAKDHKHEIDVIMGVGATDVRCTIMSPNAVGDKGLDDQLARISEAVAYCHNRYGATFTVGMDDTTRTSMEYVKKAYDVIVDAGADKTWFADTHGVSIPSATRYLTMEIKNIIGDMPLACHIHNQVGMGTATTLTAIEGGVNEPDCTWNGYGDQAGNACLEEVVCDLEVLYGVDTGVNMEKLTEISEMVEKMCGVETQKHKAFTGKDAFAWPITSMSSPTGLMLAGVPIEEIDKRIAGSKDRINPAVLGRKKTFTWGSYGGRQERVVKAKLDTMKLKYTDEDIKNLLNVLAKEVDEQVALNKELMAKKKKAYLTDGEFEKLVRKIIRA